MLEWFLELKAIPRFEYMAYWIIGIMAGMWGGAGWALYHNARKDLLSRDKPSYKVTVEHVKRGTEEIKEYRAQEIV